MAASGAVRGANGASSSDGGCLSFLVLSREYGNIQFCIYPRAPSYLSSRLLGYVTIGYIEPSSHYLGYWSPRVYVFIYAHICMYIFTYIYIDIYGLGFSLG